MKKLLAALLLFAFMSCNKDHECEDGETVCVEGTLRYSSPAVDGVGWYIQVNDTSSQLYMIQEASIADSVKTNGLRVATCLKETNVRYHYVMSATPSDYNYYRILTIKKR